ncbi:hypothetical protein NLU13_7860 [Sarocladium strictum]|uniref:FAD dependent oxidoreductase domain-containing protein n=1 Tax=Sarocladium strictum TaxID=5046 RepID=A0AA39L681_SARSR|nr:hypothetical protein NLU13_7860 [Sarocladium strictum]
MAERNTVVVIGAGIIGLTTALRLQESLDPSRHEVVVVSEEWPTSIPGVPVKHSVNYASMWAGAHVRPIPASTPQLRREAAWLRRTVQVFEEQLQSSLVGVTKCKGIEFLEAPPPEYTGQTQESFTSETGLSNYRKYSSSELPAGVKLGFEYETYCINAPVYCASLLRRFVVRGGKCVKHHLANEREAYAVWHQVSLVVNASGTGFGDPKTFPTRGQTVLTDLVAAKDTVTLQKADGTWSFIIPRFLDGGTVVGGTKQPGDWSSIPSVSTRESLLSEGSKIAQFAMPHPRKLEAIKVVSDIVGRRPTREGGMRIEVESLDSPESGLRVIHAYGAGGRGFETSWGIAEDVVELVKVELLGQSHLTVAKL